MKKARNKSRPVSYLNCTNGDNLKVKFKFKEIRAEKISENVSDAKLQAIPEFRILEVLGSKSHALKLSTVQSGDLPSIPPLSMRPLRQKKQNVRYQEDSDNFSEKTMKKGKFYKGKNKNKTKKCKDIGLGLAEKIKENSNKKKRNSEKRKEKSRDAARCRRGKESEIFGELGSLLPIESQVNSSLDKASVIRVATAFLRTRSLVTWGLDIPSDDLDRLSDSLGCNPFEGEFLQALDGFLIILTHEGEVVYTSENITDFLGISQIDVIGHSLLDYTHPCDHDEVRHLATLTAAGPNNTFLRFKCTLTPKGRSVNLKSASYKVVQITGQVLGGKENKKCITENSLPARGGNSWVVALGVPVPHPSNIEVPLDKQTFVSKHSLDMKFTYVDENVKDFCGYCPEDLLGRSLYQFNHALDTQLVIEAYKTLRSKGQVETGRYRLLSYGGGYVWVVTQATLISGHRDNKPQYVVCLNYVVSQVELGDVIFSDCQLRASQSKTSSVCHQQPSTLCSPSFTSIPSSVSSFCLPPSDLTAAAPSTSTSGKPLPVAATCSLLRDRTEDMNEGYLTFADIDSHVTILKEEPEDLTHLAPSVGEDCVPLEIPVYLPVFDDLLVPEPDCYLSKDDEGKVHYKDNIKDPIEILLNESPLTPTFQGGAESPVKRPRVYESEKFFFSNNFKTTVQTNLQRPADQFRCRAARKVPERGASSTPHISTSLPLSPFGFDTSDTESSFSPLLSQTASPLTPEKYNNVYGGDPKPIPATTKLFAPLEDDNSSSSSNAAMDLFHSFNLKLEEDLELRAPYIPPIDEVLAFDQDELFGISTDRRDEMPCFGEKQSKDELSSNILGESFSLNHTFQQNKNGAADTGGSFVDPNQVLPGQFYIKGEEKDSLQELRYLLEAPPPSPVKEQVEPPPPLRSSSCVPSILFIKTGSKRPSSPAGFAIAKKFRPATGFVPTSSASAPSPRREQVLCRTTSIGKKELPTPHAPLMQQLLVSKNPIRVRSQVVAPLSSSSQNSRRYKRARSPSGSNPEVYTHSVLRNLLVSGRDERTGYAVVSSAGCEEDPKGGEGDKSDPLNSASPLHPINSFPVNKEGKIELTRQQLSELLDRAGSFRSLFKVNDGGDLLPPTPPESFSPACISPLTPPTTMGDSTIEKPLLMLDSSLSSIPSLFDLTSFDCEVNAPAPDPSLLQGSELFMALEQTQ